MMLLQKFRNKLDLMKNQEQPENIYHKISHEQLDQEIASDGWLNHKLSFNENVTPVLAKDASTKNDDWYDAYDPRNSLNKRKRGETSTNKKKNKY